jgi:hypothetical protein
VASFAIPMKSLILGAALLSMSCAPSVDRGVSVLPTSPTVTKETALRTAVGEVRRRKLHLPNDYKTTVENAFISQEMRPTIPVFTVSFFSETNGKRTQIYQVAVNRSNGEIQYFFNLLNLTPVDR